jgi:hypothetical protein
LSISIAFAHAGPPFPLEMTMFFGPACAPAGTAEDKAAALNIQSLLVTPRSPFQPANAIVRQFPSRLGRPAFFTKLLQLGYDFYARTP